VREKQVAQHILAPRNSFGLARDDQGSDGLVQKHQGHGDTP
jgi:hypothetical protein